MLGFTGLEGVSHAKRHTLRAGTSSVSMATGCALEVVPSFNVPKPPSALRPHTTTAPGCSADKLAMLRASGR